MPRLSWPPELKLGTKIQGQAHLCNNVVFLSSLPLFFLPSLSLHPSSPLSLHLSLPLSHLTAFSFPLLTRSSSIDVSMAQMFTISDSESEPSEEIGETKKDQSSAGKGITGGPIGHALTVPEMRLAGRTPQRTLGNNHYWSYQGRIH